jgi:hypothetical protein
MPNHVMNKLIVGCFDSAFDKEAFKGAVAGMDSSGSHSDFCFHKIIPQPEIFRKTEASSTAEEAIFLLGLEFFRGMVNSEIES